VIIIPETQTVVILVPRTGTKSLKHAIAATYPDSFQIYRHMEADGVPTGYDRWRRVGVVREPLDRLWSLYRFLSEMGGQRDGKGKWEPAYVERQRRSAAVPFDEWLRFNETVFTSPYDSACGSTFYPGFTVKHSLPENRKSQFIYLRPDIGTEIWRFDDMPAFHATLGVSAGREHYNPDRSPPPSLSRDAAEHVQRFFAWDAAAVATPLTGRPHD
jgi:hypothetical protein